MKKILNKSLYSYIKTIVIIFVILTIFGYALFQARNIIIGPIIEIMEPKNGVSVEESIIKIVGKAKNISHISMNNNQIFTDDKGIFKEKLLLSYGYNIITIKAQDRFNREVVAILELIYK